MWVWVSGIGGCGLMADEGVVSGIGGCGLVADEGVV